MSFRRLFSLAALIFALAGVATPAVAQHEGGEGAPASEKTEKKGFNASEVIFGHIADSHYWHLFDINGEPVSMPLPVIIYNPAKGLETFSAEKFHHGHESYNGYKLTFGMKEKIVAEDGS